MKLTELSDADQSIINRYCKELRYLVHTDSNGNSVLSLSNVLSRIEASSEELLQKSEKLSNFRRRVDAMLAQDIRGIGKQMPDAIALQAAIYVDKCEEVSNKLYMMHRIWVILEEVDTIYI